MAISNSVGDDKLIDLHAALPDRPPWQYLSGLIGPAECLLAVDKINTIHQTVPVNAGVAEFCRFSLNALGIDYALAEQDLHQIPSNGPLVMVANHPFGGLEGIILAEVLLKARTDVRILGNYLLTRIPALASHIIPIDPFNPVKAARANARGLKQALRWVAKGGALLTFPAGEVSHLHLRPIRVEDAAWSPHVAALIVKTKAKIQPVYIHGRNSVLFNLMGLLHPSLRTAMLPREMVWKKSSCIQMTMGSPMGWRKLADHSSHQAAAGFLRTSTYFLKHRNARQGSILPIANIGKNKTKKKQPIIAPVPKSRLLHEIESLSPEHRLVDQKTYTVYLTTSKQSPEIMREIGRLREASFRDVGEGTGRSLDIDRFDGHYQQLLLWNHATKEIVGAYRIGQADRLFREKGPNALYSSTLFNYKPLFLNHMDHALELGRSFIQTAYQKKFGCLSILWRGIGEFVVRHPQYRYLFGPVSISRNYHTISRNLMVEFLSRNALDLNMSRMVKARRPVKLSRSAKRIPPTGMWEKGTLENISMLISEIEQDNKGVPTLIKHYLKLNGQFLAFNLDKEFADVIDGLIWVDLLETDPKIVKRFLGEQGTAAFYQFHQSDVLVKAA